MNWMNIEVFDVCKQQRPENPTCSSLGASQLVSPVACCADALLWGQLLDMPSTQLQLSPSESNWVQLHSSKLYRPYRLYIVQCYGLVVVVELPRRRILNLPLKLPKLPQCDARTCFTSKTWTSKGCFLDAPSLSSESPTLFGLQGWTMTTIDKYWQSAVYFSSPIFGSTQERKVRKWIGPGHEERIVNYCEYVATNTLHMFLFERLRSCAEEDIPNEESENKSDQTWC